jgi:Enoyl-(Acyl carrier protein) reductase
MLASPTSRSSKTRWLYCQRVEYARITWPGKIGGVLFDQEGDHWFHEICCFGIRTTKDTYISMPSARMPFQFVSNLSRGAVGTPIFRNAEALGVVDAKDFGERTLMKRLGKPEEVAEVMKFLLSDKASYVTGCNPSFDCFNLVSGVGN